MNSFALKSWLFLPQTLLAAVLAIDPVPAYNHAVDEGVFGYYPVHTFVTEESLSSPLVNWLQWSPLCDDTRLHFLTPRGGYVNKPGPMILDAVGELVWSQSFENDFGSQAYNLQVQRYQGEEYLTFWLGDDAVRGHGAGVYQMLNSSYDIVHTIEAAGNHSADLHEFIVTPQNTALLTVYDVVPYNLSNIRASVSSDSSAEAAEADDQERIFIWDCLIQEVSIHTSELLFEWRASKHVNVSDSYHDIEEQGSQDSAYDWFHINSIAKDEIGNYLISARYTHSIMYIDGKTGDILWTLGGRSNMFMDLSNGTALNFAWQHDARFHELKSFPEIYSPPADAPHVTRMLLTLFDNAAEDQDYDYGSGAARGLVLEITYPTVRSPNATSSRARAVPEVIAARDFNDEKVATINGSDPSLTVRVVHEYEDPRRLRSSSQGSFQVLKPFEEYERTKVLVGFGLNAVWTEFDLNGTVLCNAHYGAETSWEQGHVQSYRTYKFPWIGRPRSRPKLKIGSDGLEVFISWNGATEVRHWLLQGVKAHAEDDSFWFDISRAQKKGFETVINLPHTNAASWHYLRVLALGRDGQVLDHGISDPISSVVSGPKNEPDNKTSIEKVLGQDQISIFIVVIIALVTLSGLCGLMNRCQVLRRDRLAAGRSKWRKTVGRDDLHGEM